MARALGEVHPEEFEGLEPVASGPFTYAFEVLGEAPGTPVLVERAPQAPEHRLEAELAYGIGAGELDRAFAALRGEFQWFAPLEIVTTEHGRKAAPAPGHMANPELRFKNPITPECLGCHSDRLPPEGFPLNARPDPDWTPRGISCAACHGAVDAHAELRGGAEPDGDDPVLRMDELERHERMSVCAACHLQGDARIAFDGSLAPPPPGGDLLDSMAIFVGREVTEDVGFVSHTERLVRSACYLQDRSLSCDTCHDPHRTLFEPAGRRAVRAACQECHPGELEIEGAHASPCSRPADMEVARRDCVDCHMRKTPTFDVAEVEIQDHFIRRQLPPPSPHRTPRTLESPEADWELFRWPDRAPPDYVDDPGLWLMALSNRGQNDRAAELLDREPDERVQGIPMYHHSRGMLYERLRRGDLAIAAYEDALEIDPSFAPSAINLGLLRGMSGDKLGGIALLSEVLARYPEAVNALRNRAGLRFEIGDPAGFLADVEAAYELLPAPELAEVLADASRHDPELAREWTLRARALDPLGAGDR